MTSSANDEWNYHKLKAGIQLLAILSGTKKGSFDYENILHTIDFIEYNMREMDIIGGSGD